MSGAGGARERGQRAAQTRRPPSDAPCTKFTFGAYAVSVAPLRSVPGQPLPPVCADLSSSELKTPRASVPSARPTRSSSGADQLAPNALPLGNAVASGCFTPCWSSLSQTYAGMASRGI